jgi:hypothetical protein
MSLIPPVPGGASYELNYQSNANSAGATILAALFIPNLPAAGPPPPDPQDTSIAPAATGALTGTVPPKSSARSMEIRVQLPPGNGSGTLTLKIDDAVHSQAPITSDTTWTALVHP